MTRTNQTEWHRLTAALEAIGNLTLQELNKILSAGELAAMSAHDEIELAPIHQRTGSFYRHFLPLRKNLLSVLADSYRRYFRVALARPREAGPDPHRWAWDQLRPAVVAVLEWTRDWYMLACDGENRFVRRIGSIPFVPGQTVSFSIPTSVPPPPPPESWRAPAWLFQVSLAHVGIGPLKTEHVPARDSDQKLGAAHTRLLLKGARRTFLWALEAAIEPVRNEETAAAGAIPERSVSGQTGGASKGEASKHRVKGDKRLVRKADFSRYMHNLTERQQQAFSLKYEYALGLTAIASRMGLDRKTVDEHIKAAEKKIAQLRSGEKRNAQRAKGKPE